MPVTATDLYRCVRKYLNPKQLLGIMFMIHACFNGHLSWLASGVVAVCGSGSLYNKPSLFTDWIA